MYWRVDRYVAVATEKPTADASCCKSINQSTTSFCHLRESPLQSAFPSPAVCPDPRPTGTRIAPYEMADPTLGGTSRCANAGRFAPDPHSSGRSRSDCPCVSNRGEYVWHCTFG